MSNFTVICIVPQDLITQAKEEDSLHGFDQERDMHFSVLYTSNPKLVLNFTEIPKRTMAILYLPSKAKADYKKSANVLIKKLSDDDGFYLVADQPIESSMRTYKKEPHIGLSKYLATIAKTTALSSQLAAA